MVRAARVMVMTTRVVGDQRARALKRATRTKRAMVTVTWMAGDKEGNGDGSRSNGDGNNVDDEKDNDDVYDDRDNDGNNDDHDNDNRENKTTTETATTRTKRRQTR